jgi:hypothetical protein
MSYEILKIKKHRGVGPFREYLVEWMDRSCDDSWLTPDHMNGNAAIEKYFDRIKRKRTTRADVELPTQHYPKRFKAKPLKNPYQHLAEGDVVLSGKPPKETTGCDTPTPRGNTPAFEEEEI